MDARRSHGAARRLARRAAGTRPRAWPVRRSARATKSGRLAAHVAAWILGPGGVRAEAPLQLEDGPRRSPHEPVQTANDPGALDRPLVGVRAGRQLRIATAEGHRHISETSAPAV